MSSHDRRLDDLTLRLHDLVTELRDAGVTAAKEHLKQLDDLKDENKLLHAHVASYRARVLELEAHCTDKDKSHSEMSERLLRMHARIVELENELHRANEAREAVRAHHVLNGSGGHRG